MHKSGRWLRLAQACVAGIALGSLVPASLPPESYTQDLQVDYLTAWALRDGIDIFTPLTELSARYFPVATDNFPHASPHPPFLALISLPLTLLPFSIVAPLWLVFNIALLIVIGRWLGLSIQVSLAFAAWPPLWCLLYIGQSELLILALAMLGWRTATNGRDWRAGLWLGLAAGLKLYPALFLVPFAVRGRLRLLLAAGAVFTLTQLGNLITVGATGLLRYYNEILPAVSGHYLRKGLNASPYGALLRLFGGATDVSPVVHAPEIVVPVTVALSLLALLALVKLKPEAAPVAALVALPSAWYYYAVLALPQVVSLLRSKTLRRAALVATVAASFVLPLINLLLGPISQFMQWFGTNPPPMAVLLAVQPLSFIGLLVLSLLQTREVAGASEADLTGSP